MARIECANAGGPCQVWADRANGEIPVAKAAAICSSCRKASKEGASQDIVQNYRSGMLPNDLETE